MTGTFGNDDFGLALHKHLPKLPNLPHISLSTRYLRPPFGDGIPILKPFAHIPPYAPKEGGYSKADACRPLTELFQALQLSRAQIKVLSLDLYNLGTDIFDIPSDGLPEWHLSVFENLTRVNLTWSTIYVVPGWRYPLLARRITELLSNVAPLLQHARALCHLQFGFGVKKWHPEIPFEHDHLDNGRYQKVHGRSPFHSLFNGTSYWPQLTTLKLDSMPVNSNDFVRFITKHGSSLKELSLQNVDLIEGSSWVEVAECFADLNLTGIRIINPAFISLWEIRKYRSWTAVEDIRCLGFRRPPIVMQEPKGMKLYPLGSEARRIQDAEFEECGLILEGIIMRARPNKLNASISASTSTARKLQSEDLPLPLDERIQDIMNENGAWSKLVENTSHEEEDNGDGNGDEEGGSDDDEEEEDNGDEDDEDEEGNSGSSTDSDDSLETIEEEEHDVEQDEGEEEDQEEDEEEDEEEEEEGDEYEEEEG